MDRFLFGKIHSNLSFPFILSYVSSLSFYTPFLAIGPRSVYSSYRLTASSIRYDTAIRRHNCHLVTVVQRHRLSVAYRKRNYRKRALRLRRTRPLNRFERALEKMNGNYVDFGDGNLRKATPFRIASVPCLRQIGFHKLRDIRRYREGSRQLNFEEVFLITQFFNFDLVETI